MAPRHPNDPGTRVQALTMLQLGRNAKEIAITTGLDRTTIGRIEKRARARGYTPETDPKILIAYVEDAPRAGRPKKVTLEVEEAVIKAISKNSTTRLLSTQAIANLISPLVQNGISARTIHRVLRRKGYKPCKPTTKPGLTKENKLTRLQWCLDHKDWTLEDWKNVIWSDETSVTWGGQRGRLRVWRTSSEAYNYHCIRRRWKGFKQFMFWGCFSYDAKGPCHIWEEETAKEKKEAKEYMDKENERNEAGKREEWELETAMRRVRLARRMGGAKPKWRWCAKTGKLERKACRGGIDWYRYWRVILEKKLLPFAKRCKLARPGTIVQEDNAPAHTHHHQAIIYNLWEIMKLIWPANSPDLNAIEPCWFWMKRQTTKRGVASSEKQLKKDWLECWEKLPQEKIQEWIERIPEHIQRIIDCRGGNEYREGRGKRKRNPGRVR
jgi:hypothetical protein